MPLSAQMPDLAVQSMLRALAHPSAVIGAGGVIVDVNVDFLHCLGHTEDHLSGETLASLVRTDQADALHAFIAAPNKDAGLRISVVMPSGIFKLSLDWMQGAGGQVLLLCQLMPDHAIDSLGCGFCLSIWIKGFGITMS